MRRYTLSLCIKCLIEQDLYNARYCHYYIDIRDFGFPKRVEIIYHRDSMVGRNPITSIVFFLLSITDAQLEKDYP